MTDPAPHFALPIPHSPAYTGSKENLCSPHSNMGSKENLCSPHFNTVNKENLCSPHSAFLSEVASSEVHPVVVVPTYNNAGTLLDVLQRVEALKLPVIVVNDGATDETGTILESWSARIDDRRATVVTHPSNRGKAAALCSGFTAARRMGFTHAITLDSDGQLLPEEIPLLLDAAARHPFALILGQRSRQTPGLPRSNRVGWFASGLGLWVETGRVIHDSQCGLRVYPLVLFDIVRCWTGRFGFETEIITRAIWAGTPIVEVPVSCHYPPRGSRVSHLRPLTDGVKGFFMHWGLAIRRLLPWPYPKLHHANLGRSAVDHDPATIKADASLREWLDPRAFLKRIRSSRLEQLFASSAFAHGVFMACMPLGWLAPLVVLYGSRRLHHHLWAALLGVSLIVRPVGPALARLSVTVGHVILHGHRPDFAALIPNADGFFALLRAFPGSWALGGLVLGTILHWATILAIFFALRWIPTSEPDVTRKA